MIRIAINDAKGKMQVVEAEQVSTNSARVNGVLYRGVTTVTVGGERFGFYKLAPAATKRRGNCSRCGGTGQFGTLGVCWKCSGTGQKL